MVTVCETFTWDLVKCENELFREIERKRYTLYTMLIGFYHLFHLWAGQVVFEIFVPYLFTTGDHMLGAVGCTSDS